LCYRNLLKSQKKDLIEQEMIEKTVAYQDSKRRLQQKDNEEGKIE
jgi:hypothetical protein